jgi:phosphoglycerate dehydrogenase-like enzyme
MTTILIAESRFAPAARAELERVGEVVPFDRFGDELPRADAIVAGLEVELDRALLDRAPRLRTIATRTSQLRHIDLDETRRRGIEILSLAPGDGPLPSTTSTAEEAFALALALVRNIPWAFDAVRERHWERARYGGHELAGKTMGLVGHGRLGRMVAGYARAFGMEVLACDPHVRIEGAEPTRLDDLLRRADVVSIHCRYDAETEGLIGARELALMKPSAVLVNTARGEIVDEPALVAELASGRIRAGLDVFAHEPHVPRELLGLPNVVLTPHLGSATRRTREAMTRLVVDNLHAVERGDAPLTPIPPNT